MLWASTKLQYNVLSATFESLRENYPESRFFWWVESPGYLKRDSVYRGFTVVSNVGRCSYNVPITGLTVVSNVGRCSYKVIFTAVFTTDF
jgi:hypothetical protein